MKNVMPYNYLYWHYKGMKSCNKIQIFLSFLIIKYFNILTTKFDINYESESACI